MNSKLFYYLTITACLALNSCTPAEESSSAEVDSSLPFAFMPSSLNQTILDVVDVNPDPNIFEASLTADEHEVNIGGTTVHSLIYKDDNRVGGYPLVEPTGIPIPQIVVNAGDQIIVTLTNKMSATCAAIACDSSIHWHGLELDNDSDGTGVTQNHLLENETYTYRFFAPRPGVFWFHTHMKPGPQTFAGMYGAFIVKDPNEATLESTFRIPTAANTHTLVLSDTEFDASGNVGFVDAGVAVPWATLRTACGGGDNASCNKIRDGATVLVNGQNPAVSTPKIIAKSGEGIRLRLINTATNRYFRLHVSNNGTDNNLYRIGGEGGFLETVRLEGGVISGSGGSGWDTKYDVGEIVVAASGRADVVIVPTGAPGSIITIAGLGYARGGGPNSDNNPAGDLLKIEIENSPAVPTFSIAAGNDVLGAGAIVNLKGLVITDSYLAVADFPNVPTNPGNGMGSIDPVIRLNSIGVVGKTAIDSVVGEFEDSGPDYTQVPFQGATRYAKTGDILEFTLQSRTAGGTNHHPFHHHGFSFQPVRIVDNGVDPEDTSDDVTLYTFDYQEFVDVIDMHAHQSIVVRMRLDDRPRITDNRQEVGAPAPNQYFGSGGAAGRWVFHCHIFLHAAVGMISELVVVNTDRDGDGVTTEFDCNDFDPLITNCNRPPVADAGPDQILECAAPGGTAGLLDGTASSDPDLDMLSYLWSAAGVTFDDASSATPTGLFPKGATTVTLTVSDGEFDDSDDVVITVEDTTPPDINVLLDPDRLWPPNHKMVTINASVSVTDSCDANPSWLLNSVTSNEPDNGKGDGNTVNDIQHAEIGTSDTQFDLRAERSGKGNGRIYTVEYKAQDADGNEASDMATVTVAHDQGN